MKLKCVKEAEGIVALMRHFTSGFIAEVSIGAYEASEVADILPSNARDELLSGKIIAITDQNLIDRIMSKLKAKVSVERHQIIEAVLEPMQQ